MKNNNNSKFAYFGIVILLSACALPKEKQTILTPAMDKNAVQIINQVKTQPSMISGGGMVYDLFVGGYFNARYNDKTSILTLTDLENTNSCQYSEEGVLQINEGTIPAYIDSCDQLSSETVQTLTQQEP